MIIEWIPAVFLASFIVVGFGWRSWLQWRRFGHSGLVLFRSGRPVQHLREAARVRDPMLAATGLHGPMYPAIRHDPEYLAILKDLGWERPIDV